jgi:hypothetical protein
MIKDGKFSLAGVEFDVSLDPHKGVERLIETIKELPHSAIQKLVKAYEIRVGEGASSFDVLLVVMGKIQNEWYLTVEGEIPMSVAKNQDAREAKVGEKKEKKAAEKKERVLTVMKVGTGKTDEIKALKGQAAQVVKVVKALGKGNVNEVGAELVKLEDFKTKQDPTRVASFYFTQLGKEGILVEA